jgi:hypothetical protein
MFSKCFNSEFLIFWIGVFCLRAYKIEDLTLINSYIELMPKIKTISHSSDFVAKKTTSSSLFSFSFLAIGCQSFLACGVS